MTLTVHQSPARGNKCQEALQCFRNILGWMNDRPVHDTKRVLMAFGIVNTAKQDADLRNEVYLQVLKQLRRNPSRRGELLGWKLLLLLCQQVNQCTPGE